MACNRAPARCVAVAMAWLGRARPWGGGDGGAWRTALGGDARLREWEQVDRIGVPRRIL
jgi:hypothetical protein